MPDTNTSLTNSTFLIPDIWYPMPGTDTSLNICTFLPAFDIWLPIQQRLILPFFGLRIISGIVCVVLMCGELIVLGVSELLARFKNNVKSDTSSMNNHHHCHCTLRFRICIFSTFHSHVEIFSVFRTLFHLGACRDWEVILFVCFDQLVFWHASWWKVKSYSEPSFVLGSVLRVGGHFVMR